MEAESILEKLVPLRLTFLPLATTMSGPAYSADDQWS